MKKTKPTTPDVVRKYEPDGLDIFGGGMPRTCEKNRGRMRHIDPHYALLLVTGLAFVVLAWISVIFDFDKPQSNDSDLVSAIETRLPELNAPIVEPTPTPEPTLTPTPETLPLPAGSDGSFKAFERKRKISDDTSAQYKLKQLYWTDEQGFCRFNDMYVVALGQFYAQRIGQVFRIQFEDRTILAIVGDVKDDKDTVDRMYCRLNGSIVEFIIDDTVMDPAVYAGGDASALGMTGKVVSILEIK